MGKANMYRVVDLDYRDRDNLDPIIPRYGISAHTRY